MQSSFRGQPFQREIMFFLDDFDIKMFDIDEDQEFKDNVIDYICGL